jgi:hypothetical protein
MNTVERVGRARQAYGVDVGERGRGGDDAWLGGSR